MRSLYDLLEVSRYASNEVIEKAYKILAKKYHPDLQTAENKAIAEEKMKKINLAYETLSNPEKRKKYDSELDKKEEQERLKQQAEQSYGANVNRQNMHVTTEVPNQNNNSNQQYQSTILDEKQRQKIAKKMAQKYEESYINYLRSLGYNVKYKWTWERVKNLLIVIVSVIIVCVIAWQIPYVRKMLIELYNSNFIIKFMIDIVISIFKTIWNIIISIFK